MIPQVILDSFRPQELSLREVLPPDFACLP